MVLQAYARMCAFMIIHGEREVLEKRAAEILAQSLQEIIDQQNRAVLAVPGGRSVGAVLRQLEFEPVDWHKVHVFMVDERLVALGHPESNFTLVSSCVDSFIKRENLHPFGYSSANNKAALLSYCRLLQDYGGRFDLVLLSSGEDGHIASLFPEHETFASDEEFFILTNSSPKPPSGRMSASKKLISSSQTAVLLFWGTEKQEALTMFMDEQVPLMRCPAKIVTTIRQHHVLTDLHG